MSFSNGSDCKKAITTKIELLYDVQIYKLLLNIINLNSPTSGVLTLPNFFIYLKLALWKLVLM